MFELIIGVLAIAFATVAAWVLITFKDDTPDDELSDIG